MKQNSKTKKPFKSPISKIKAQRGGHKCPAKEFRMKKYIVVWRDIDEENGVTVCETDDREVE